MCFHCLWIPLVRNRDYDLCQNLMLANIADLSESWISFFALCCVECEVDSSQPSPCKQGHWRCLIARHCWSLSSSRSNECCLRARESLSLNLVRGKIWKFMSLFPILYREARVFRVQVRTSLLSSSWSLMLQSWWVSLERTRNIQWQRLFSVFSLFDVTLSPYKARCHNSLPIKKSCLTVE